jgi:hypothetical protein
LLENFNHFITLQNFIRLSRVIFRFPPVLKLSISPDAQSLLIVLSQQPKIRGTTPTPIMSGRFSQLCIGLLLLSLAIDGLPFPFLTFEIVIHLF